MLAWQAIRHGSPAEVLELRAVACPWPGAGELRIRVEAASLNPIDFKLIRGDLRALSPLRFPVTPGFDACGIVDALGEGVERFHLGERVIVRASRETLGAFAQYSVQPAAFVATAPRWTGAAAAAALPLVALTSVQGLVDRAHAKPGQRILVHAGAGGLGSFAIQYARHLGLSVDATCSARNLDFVRSLGADAAIAYDREDYRARGPIYDIVLDSLGGAHTLDAFRVLKPGGVEVRVAGPPDEEMIAKFARGWAMRQAMRWMGRKVRAAARAKDARYFRFLTEPSGAQLADIVRRVDSGAIRPVVDSVFGYEQAPAAFEKLMGGHARGKIVLDFDTAVAPEES